MGGGGKWKLGAVHFSPLLPLASEGPGFQAEPGSEEGHSMLPSFLLPLCFVTSGLRSAVHLEDGELLSSWLQQRERQCLFFYTFSLPFMVVKVRLLCISSGLNLPGTTAV